MTPQTAIALFVYPGLMLALGLGVFYTVLTTKQPRFSHIRIGVVWRSAEGLLSTLSVLLASAGLVLLPWPFHPDPPAAEAWLWVWALFEGAFLLPLLPGMLAGAPPVVRAASREVQIGVMGRMALWLALAVGLLVWGDWRMVVLPVHVLAILAAVFAFPVAVGWGPFAPEMHITPGGAEHGFDSDTARLVRVARTVRVAALLAATLLVLVPAEPLLQPWAGLAVVSALFIITGVVLRRLAALLPRLPLPDALRVCWWRALPLAMAAVVYLAVISGR